MMIKKNPTKPAMHASAINHRGYLLIEALIAMTVFAIGFMAIGKMVIWTTRNNTRANITTQATLLASKKLEELKYTGNIHSLPSTTTIFNDDNPIDEYGDSGGIFNRSWQISAPLEYDTSRQIEVTVSWTRRGKQRSVALRTITRGGGT
jgi:type II secretory pathway pseudopilin PulG